MARKTTKRARVKQEEESSSPATSVHDSASPELAIASKFAYINFTSKQSRAQFLELQPRLKEPTRFLCRTTMIKLKIMSSLERLLEFSGCLGLAKMCEPTYEELTLEFLSSFSYNEQKKEVFYRIQNVDHTKTLREWGELIGARYHGKTSVGKQPQGHDEFWRSLTGKARPKGGKLRAHLIEHPVVRMWCRLVGMTYFARDESTNLTNVELDILLGTIGPKKFDSNVAHYVAAHFAKIGRGKLKDVMVGGLITYIARQSETRLRHDKMSLVGSENPPLMSAPYLMRLNYLKACDTSDKRNKSYWWLVDKKKTIVIPLMTQSGTKQRGEYNGIQQEVPYGHYLLTKGDGASTSASTSAPPPPFQGHYITPPGDYSQFTYKPFATHPFDTSYYDPSAYPRTFAVMPPIQAPPVWTEDAQAACTFAYQQSMLHMARQSSLAMHNIYAWHMDQGHFPVNTFHPDFYVPLEPVQEPVGLHAGVEVKESASDEEEEESEDEDDNASGGDDVGEDDEDDDEIRSEHDGSYGS